MRDDVEVESRIAGVLGFTFGAVLTVWALRSGAKGVIEMEQSLLGPTLIALGIGLMIHPTRIALAGINTLTRVYGLAGAFTTIAMLAFHGFFTRPKGDHLWLWLMQTALPFVMVVYWSLPSRMIGGPAYDPLAPPPRRPPA